MSVRVMTAAWAADMPAGDKLVLLALADCANDEGRCWPGLATLERKTGKSRRSLQSAIQSLCRAGHLTREEVVGKGCNYTVHPQESAQLSLPMTPAKSAPPQKMHGRNKQQEGAQKLHPTPAKSAPKPSKKPKEPSKSRRAIPDDWMPSEFGEGSQSRKVIDSWPEGELDAQLEQFKANHRAKGNTFIDPQDAWSTWVLNTRKFGVGRKESTRARYVSASGYEYRGSDEEVMREAERRNDMNTYWRVKGDQKRKVAA